MRPFAIFPALFAAALLAAQAEAARAGCSVRAHRGVSHFAHSGDSANPGGRRRINHEAAAPAGSGVGGAAGGSGLRILLRRPAYVTAYPGAEGAASFEPTGAGVIYAIPPTPPVAAPQMLVWTRHGWRRGKMDRRQTIVFR